MKTLTKESGKVAYQAPALEIISMEMEGVIATSGEPLTPGDMRSTRSVRPYSNASSSDLEDMINDILTVEN